MSKDDDGGAFSTLSQLRQTLDERGLKPKKSLGQHFLIDRNLMTKLLESAELTPADCVLEIGAGTGCLTGLLARRAGRVVAAEIDQELAAIAAERLVDCGNVELLCLDALEKKSEVSPRLLDALRDASTKAGGPTKLVANLPYDIATSLVMNLLIAGLPLERFCFTVQAEVADRFLAEPDTADYGPVSIISQTRTPGWRGCRGPPEAGWPRPNVDSTMLLLYRRRDADVPAGELQEFAALVRSFFLHRRKTLTWTVRQAPNAGRLLQGLEWARIPTDCRPETVTVRQWAEIHNATR